MTPEELADQVLLLGFDGTDALGRRSSRSCARASSAGSSSTPRTGPTRRAGPRWSPPCARPDAAQGRIPPLIVAAQEGGRYRSFADLPPERTELEIGDGGSIDERAEDWAREAAEALRSAGFDLNLFPVADVATLDSPLGDRAFSDDPATVTELTAAAIRGCAAAGLACAAVHFPGLGAASEDTDAARRRSASTRRRSRPATCGPFAPPSPRGCRRSVLSLAFYAAYDPVTPAAPSRRRSTTGLLRDRLGFEGVAITDDLGAGAVRAGYSAPKAAVAALAAGADLIRIDAPGEPARRSRGDRRRGRERIAPARPVCSRRPPACSS